MAEVAADVATLRAVLPEFEYSATLDEAAHAAELRARQQEISTAKAELQQQLQAEKAKVLAAEEEVSLAKDAEKTRADKLNEKVTMLIDRQVDLQTADKEYREVEASGRCEAQTGEELREAMQKHEHITNTVISSLLAGTCTSGKAKSEYLEAVRGYLQEIQVEKTLVAAADGLGVAPDKRGTFDKMAIDSITEALADKRRSLEEVLAARAPAEKEARAELLGLWALTDVCREKAEAAEAEHKKVEDEVKAAKGVMKALRQRVLPLPCADSASGLEHGRRGSEVMCGFVDPQLFCDPRTRPPLQPTKCCFPGLATPAWQQWQAFDMYLNSPRGSNNKLREQSNNVQSQSLSVHRPRRRGVSTLSWWSALASASPPLLPSCGRCNCAPSRERRS
eukprot:s3701_g2.t1